jgi:uncharacterized membrane protein
MNIYLLILLRVIHVFTVAQWVGIVIFYFFFIKPSIQVIGPAAPKFMQSLNVLFDKNRIQI